MNMSKPLGPLQVHQRRQAHPIHRAAAGQDISMRGLPLSPHPPYPPITKLPQPAGTTERPGRRSIGFGDKGRRWQSLQPVDWAARNLVTLDSPKAIGQFATFGIPQVGKFLPHIAAFLPHIGFCRFVPFLSLFLSFKRREREEEREKARKGQSTGWKWCLKKHPRVFAPIHGFSVDAFLSKTQCWRGFTPDLAAIHASTGRNAPTPPGRVCS